MGTAIDLRRFKKDNEGVKILASLIEQATESKRKMIITKVGGADSEFLNHCLRKVVFFEELVFFEEGVLAEILATTPAITLAYALKGMAEEFRKKMIGLMGYRQVGQIKDEEDKMPITTNPILVSGAQRQILKIARQLEGRQSFVFELDDCPRFHTK